MSPDHRLIAAAQRLAGAHVHDVSHRVHVYEGACLLLNEHLTRAERVRVIHAMRRAERWLRAFVCMQQIPAS